MKKADEAPPWLKRMENGTIGEARTRAFLSDRFWILERSVDVDGADFLIQRRLTQIADRDPPRLGVVQVKFLQDEDTTHYIDPKYLLTRDGTPAKEFFLMCHSGVGDRATKYLLTADTVVKDFQMAPETHQNAGKYVLPGRRVLVPKYRVESADRALDMIEQALILADLNQNRRFLYRVFAPDVSPEAIEGIFKVDLGNDWGDLPREFYKLKRKVERVLLDIEEVVNDLRAVVAETDPIKALELLDGGAWTSHVGRSGRGQIQFDADFFDDDFYEVAREHKRRHDLLVNEGLLDRFLLMKRDLAAQTIADLAPRMKLPADIAQVISLTYDAASLKTLRVEFEYGTLDDFGVAPSKEGETEGTVRSAPGRIVTYWLPGRYGYGTWTKNGYVEASNPAWAEALQPTVGTIIHSIMSMVFDHRFPEPVKN
jgi:hypothetical protein